MWERPELVTSLQVAQPSEQILRYAHLVAIYSIDSISILFTRVLGYSVLQLAI